VLYASAATNIRGNWTKASSSTAAGGTLMRSADKRWSRPDAPLPTPTHSFDLRFDAVANTPYRIWLRLRAQADSKWNDSVWVQFSDALVDGRRAFEVGTTSALLVNLEQCATCGVAGWGWVNSAYWLTQGTSVTFAQSGTKTIRIQTREDGLDIDQVVLSPSRFVTTSPGRTTNDATVLPPSAAAPGTTGVPYGGKAKGLPGTIQAANFDEGGSGVAYIDSTPGNASGVYRSGDVDLLPTTGGYFVGWTTAGEWLRYTVNVVRAGTYMVRVKAASIKGGSIQVSLGEPSNVSKTIKIPRTGGAQRITTVSVPMVFAAGKQVVTVKFLTADVNLRSLVVQLP
jgi:hypothetical protein